MYLWLDTERGMEFRRQVPVRCTCGWTLSEGWSFVVGFPSDCRNRRGTTTQHLLEIYRYIIIIIVIIIIIIIIITTTTTTTTKALFDIYF